MKSPRSPLFSRPRPAIVALITALLLPGGGSPQARAAEKPASTRLEDFLKRLGFEAIEFKWDDHEPLVQGQLGGKKRTFLLDTGWGLTTLDERVARGLKPLEELKVTSDDDSRGQVPRLNFVLMEELTLGRVKFLNQPARVMKLKAGSTPWLRDGVLGFDFLLGNHCLIDCAGQRVYVHPSKPSEKVAATLAGSLRLSGMAEVATEGVLGTTVEAEVNGQGVKLLVDTGSFATIIDNSQVTRLGLTRLKYADPRTGSHIRENVQSTMAGVVGTEPFSVGEVKSFRMASQSWRGVQMGVANLKRWGLAKPGTRDEEIQGLLGVELLVNHGALIDFTTRRLWFRPGP